MWIKEIEQNNIKKEIEELTKNIEKNNLILGEKLFFLKKKNSKINYEDFKITKAKAEQLISNYIFAKKYNIIEDIGFTKLSFLSKIKNKTEKEIQSLIIQSKNHNISEFKNIIYNKNTQKIITKSFNLDEEDNENYKLSKKIAENIANTKLNQNQVIKYILMDFINNNNEYIEFK